MYSNSILKSHKNIFWHVFLLFPSQRPFLSFYNLFLGCNPSCVCVWAWKRIWKCFRHENLELLPHTVLTRRRNRNKEGHFCANHWQIDGKHIFVVMSELLILSLSLSPSLTRYHLYFGLFLFVPLIFSEFFMMKIVIWTWTDPWEYEKNGREREWRQLAIEAILFPSPFQTFETFTFCCLGVSGNQFSHPFPPYHSSLISFCAPFCLILTQHKMNYPLSLPLTRIAFLSRIVGTEREHPSASHPKPHWRISNDTHYGFDSFFCCFPSLSLPRACFVVVCYYFALLCLPMIVGAHTDRRHL